MHLTREEERILAGEEGPAKARALEAIIRVGEALGAEGLVEIKHAHVSGVSYGTIGDAGLHFIEELAELGARVAVPTTLNPVGFDTSDPRLLARVPGVRLDESFISGQLRIIRALRRLGIRATLTCTPYYVPESEVEGLRVGDHVAWGESSAIAYANSVLGLRTNREGGPLALLAAIAGRTYLWGMHLDGERVPRTTIVFEGVLDDALAGVAGLMVAEIVEDVPYVEARFSSEMALREFLAALGTAGRIARAVIPGITPDYRGPRPPVEAEYTLDDVRRRMDELSASGDPSIVFLGCPHARAEEVVALAEKILSLGGPSPRVEVVATLSRHEALRARRLGGDKLARAGVRLIADTCLIVSPFGRGQEKPVVATNSYKAFFYLTARGVPVRLAPLDELARIAVGA